MIPERSLCRLSFLPSSWQGKFRSLNLIKQHRHKASIQLHEPSLWHNTEDVPSDMAPSLPKMRAYFSSADLDQASPTLYQPALY
eukprot:5082583-Amphidinium_carterae.1